VSYTKENYFAFEFKKQRNVHARHSRLVSQLELIYTFVNATGKLNLDEMDFGFVFVGNFL
jgi:F0F1-type ATP synthase membrane subunit a